MPSFNGKIDKIGNMKFHDKIYDKIKFRVA